MVSIICCSPLNSYVHLTSFVTVPSALFRRLPSQDAGYEFGQCDFIRKHGRSSLIIDNQRSNSLGNPFRHPLSMRPRCRNRRTFGVIIVGGIRTSALAICDLNQRTRTTRKSQRTAARASFV